MRLRVCLDNPTGTRLPINYQEWLTAAVYSLLADSDADYARRLHDDGYADGDGRRFKLFTFSWLRGTRRTVDGDTLRFAPGPLEWLIASPLEDFLTNLATGLLAAGTLHVGPAALPITQVETLPAPLLSETSAFTCLSPIIAALPLPDGRTRYLRPIIAALPLPDGRTRYLRPGDGDAFCEAVRRNLLRKHRLLHGSPPADDRFALTFDPAYLARTGGGTKLITFKGIHLIGAFAPFTLSGSVDLMRMMLECGAGEKNAAGFGMVETKPNPHP